MGGPGGEDIQAAAGMNSALMKQYAAVGLPALRGGLEYTAGALNQGGLPSYVENAYAGARTGAMEAASNRMSGARGQLLRNMSNNGGGAFLGNAAAVAGGGANALLNESQAIGTTHALAGVEQRNKLLNILAGGGASATNLSAGFGQLTNEGLGIRGQQPGAYPYVVGGLSALGTAYSMYNTRQNQTHNYGQTLGLNDTLGSG
jgi:hypothetical protein